jgi:ubiquinone/menaquinone biosynthesis C-methylase UbiE
VRPFDIGPADAVLPDVPLTQAIPPVVRSLDPVALPFETATFEAVLSCGVLEHVDEHSQPGNELKSLREIARVLKPGGSFLIYQLPQQYAWQEALIRRFKLGYSHPRRYTAGEIERLLRDAGYRVTRIRRANLIPKNLTGLPRSVRRIYNRFSQPLLALDRGLSSVPLLNQVAGVMEIVAQRNESA